MKKPTKKYKLLLVDDSDILVGEWVFDVDENLKLKFLPSGKVWKDAIREHEEKKNDNS